ncbi:MAG: hypothetical protein J0I06_18795 [Planctomycetes bacterium]|nr:hypothetical protein [Planctomycetota bacterium]
MRTAATFRTLLAAALALVLSAATAGARDAVKITGATVGFPHAARDRDEGLAKFGAWAPVFVSLEVLREVAEPAELFLEAPDADEIGTSLAVPLDLAGVSSGSKVLAADRGCVGYVRPAGAAGELVVTVRTAKGTALSEPFRVRLRPREPLIYAVLAIGGQPANFELPKPASGDTGPLRAGRVELAHTNDFAQLPDQWFGYDGVDLVLLNTGGANPALLQRLFASDEPGDARRRNALLEWVRRGGRLAVSVGVNAPLVGKFPHLNPVLPFAINPVAPGRTADAVELYWSAGTGQANTLGGVLGGAGGPAFPLAHLVPHKDKAARVVIPPAGRAVEGTLPVAAQSALGLGRVTVIGFDLDREPFASFPRRADFWDWVLRECGTNRASAGGDGKPRPPGALTEEEDEAAVAIRQHNDSFDGVAVVSFGWIAMLIVLYILLIGPIEYYFLKRVLGRLELTWVTFPIIVLTVSAAAYLSADAVKGRELKVNKLDVVDVDPASGRVYGTTWFTVFSPKIDKYTIGVTPGDGWGYSDGGVTVSAIGAPRGGRPGIVRRKYAIHADDERVADALEGVPIQVWSTKAFTASWSGLYNTGGGHFRTAVESDLVHPPGDRSKVIGTFTHTLNVPTLTDCVAFYAGEAYPLPGDVIVRGQRVRLVLDQSTQASQWLQNNSKSEALLSRVQSYAERPGQKAAQKAQPQTLTGPLPLLGMLFHEATLKNEEGVYARNASLRRLDQSWRLSPENRDEVIVVGRAAPPSGPAEEVLSGPYAPAKLWLKGLPGAGERWKIPGTARQETWVRFYLPVR